MKYVNYNITDENGKSNCVIRSFCKLFNKSYSNVYNELITIQKELNADSFNDVEVFEEYMKRHNTNKVDSSEIKVKDLVLDDNNYVVFCYDKNDFYHMVPIMNNTIYDKNEDCLGLYVLGLYKNEKIKDKFFYEVPSIDRKEDAIQYINEFYANNSNINGAGGLHRFLNDYEGWLKKLEDDYTCVPNEDRVPARTYFLVRESDNKIIGMSNIRLALNERLKRSGGHIGYAIRPSERGKGLNKINLYLALKVCDEYNIDTVLMDADIKNPASWKTMEALGGVRAKEYYESLLNTVVVDYNIDVKKSLEEHKDYEEYVSPKNVLDKSLGKTR